MNKSVSAACRILDWCLYAMLPTQANNSMNYNYLALFWSFSLRICKAIRKRPLFALAINMYSLNFAVDSSLVNLLAGMTEDNKISVVPCRIITHIDSESILNIRQLVLPQVELLNDPLPLISEFHLDNGKYSSDWMIYTAPIRPCVIVLWPFFDNLIDERNLSRTVSKFFNDHLAMVPWGK